ncbi:hypothetical protein C8Q72DRAFT_848759 [Fomitopsis betulina]|nr:hypothetical protein C8Q72DRAFT_848759 [Fomitopsis betulina]
MPIPPADVFGVIYIIENAQQFWSELEDMLNISDGLTLERLDATLRRFISLCAAYHEQYLQSPLQMEHACDLLIASELFQFHSQRMTGILFNDTQKATDPHEQLILYAILLAFGRRKTSFLRDQKRWQPLLPLLMDNVLVGVDPDVEDSFSGTTNPGGSGYQRAVAVPIEAKLRTQSVRILYEVCRVQRMTMQDLEVFSDSFIDFLFELVEQTRHMQDDTFNYSVIKLIVALNEQFMVAGLHEENGGKQHQKTETDNRVLQVLMARRGSSMTFGENMIFMLNRAGRSPEDLCMQLLVLKLLYLLFRTEGMSEYFYTNDLCVLVDVFLREIGNIDENNESLRHTYLRVLHPLLTKTQLRSMPYKRAQIVHTLESLIENEPIWDIDPTTKRLVQRCLSGEWCVQFRKTDIPKRVTSPALSATSASAVSIPPSVDALASSRHERSNSIRGKNRAASRSAENLLDMGLPRRPSDQNTSRGGHGHGHLDNLRQPSADSTTSLPRIVTAVTTANTQKFRHRAGSMDAEATTAAFSTLTTRERNDDTPTSAPAAQASMVITDRIARPSSPRSPIEPPDSPGSVLSSSSSSTMGSKPHRRAAPPPPAKRRKPPAIPAGKPPASHSFSALGASSSQLSLTSRMPRRP